MLILSQLVNQLALIKVIILNKLKILSASMNAWGVSSHRTQWVTFSDLRENQSVNLITAANQSSKGDVMNN